MWYFLVFNLFLMYYGSYGSELVCKIVLQAPNYYPHCDGGGCGTNACDGIAGQYGPGWLMSMMVFICHPFVVQWITCHSSSFIEIAVSQKSQSLIDIHQIFSVKRRDCCTPRPQAEPLTQTNPFSCHTPRSVSIKNYWKSKEQISAQNSRAVENIECKKSFQVRGGDGLMSASNTWLNSVKN